MQKIPDLVKSLERKGRGPGYLSATRFRADVTNRSPGSYDPSVPASDPDRLRDRRVAALGGLAVFTELGVRHIERAHPPSRPLRRRRGRPAACSGARPRRSAAGRAAARRLRQSRGHEAWRSAIGLRRAIASSWSTARGTAGATGRTAATMPRRRARPHSSIRRLERIGITRAIVVGYSWSGALATAYALAYPDSVAGLVLLAPVTHPWPGGVGWYNPDPDDAGARDAVRPNPGVSARASC